MLIQLLAVFFIATPGCCNCCANEFTYSAPSPRIKLKDGRHLAYREYGVPKEEAKYIIVVVHGFDSSKDETFPASQVPKKELVEELGICFVSFDRAGYGESDPNPKRTVQSESMDIEELANRLDLGSRFYLIGTSIGGYSAYSCLKYIPQRLNGVVLLVPAVNYWWPSLPANTSRSAFMKLDLLYQNSFWVAHNLPFLFCGWMKPNLFGSSLVIDEKIEQQQIMPIRGEFDAVDSNSTHKNVYESRCRDVMVVFSDWQFDPLQMENPFPNNNQNSVHLWANAEDEMCQVEIQRHVAEKLPWVRYHEVPYGGHIFFQTGDWGDRIIRALLLAEDQI